ncbi:MAG: hypothetical protein V3R16_02585 [Nitrospirales bacterium]
MSRSGYTDGIDQWDLIRWRGAVESAIRGKRGQAFLREMLTALDALPEPKLIAEDLIRRGQVCAIGSVGRHRRIGMSHLNPTDSETIATLFGIAEALVKEIAYVNDEECYRIESSAERFTRVRQWVVRNLKGEQ